MNERMVEKIGREYNRLNIMNLKTWHYIFSVSYIEIDYFNSEETEIYRK